MWADCCQLLQLLLDKMLAQQSTLEVVGAQLQHILASILASLQNSMVSLRQLLPSPSLTAPRLQSTAAGDDVGAEHPLVKLILRLTVEAPAGLHVYLRDVEPLLPLPALDAACRCCLAIRLACQSSLSALGVSLVCQFCLSALSVSFAYLLLRSCQC